MGWIFGYGSLMWHPGFEYRERRAARMKGYHREFCMVSTRNRGTTETPGLVLSLCPGGELVGLAYRYDPPAEAEVLKYLDDREGVDRAHKRVTVPTETLDGPEPRLLHTLTYLPIVTAPNYDCRMPLEKRAALVAQGQGKIGSSYDYLRLLLEELRKLNQTDTHLSELFTAACALGAAAGQAPAAAGK